MASSRMALQGAGALGLGGRVPAQQRSVLAAQARQFDPLGAQLGVEPGPQHPGLFEVGFELGYPLVRPPLVLDPLAAELGDAAVGRAVPGAHDDGAGRPRRPP